MGIELVTAYASKVDELFKAESKTGLLTNQDYDFDGEHTVKIYSVSTAQMNDYVRNDTTNTMPSKLTRFGNLNDLSATTQTVTMQNDRSFIFNIDKLDEDETGTAISAETALMRQLREVVIPERDKYIYNIMTTEAGSKPEAVSKTGFKWYEAILDGTLSLDESEVPEDGRVLVVSPVGYAALKKELNQVSYNELDAEARLAGVIGYLDGMPVIKVPSSYLPSNFGFMIVHPSACCAPVKLADYGIYQDTPLASGTIVTGRIVYDAFVLNNKKAGIYYQEFTKSNTN